MKKWSIISPVLLLASWSAFTYGNLVNVALIPPPHKVVVELWGYSIRGEILTDLLPTLKCLFCGLAMGTAMGIFFGIVLGYFTKLYEALDFVIDFFRSIPATALFPIFMLLFGLGDSSMIMVIVYACGFKMLINTAYGVRNSKKIRVLVAETMGASRSDILTKVVLPDALPYIAAGFRVTVSVALVVTIVLEMLMGSDVGLGYRMMESKILFDIPNVYAVLIIIGLLGYALNKVSFLVEKRLVHWSGE